MTLRPMLAATIKSDTDLTILPYPLIASPKLDGIRCLIHPEFGPVSRKFKPIPNTFIREFLNQPKFHGLDGELIVGSTFNETTSAVMSSHGEPDFTYWVFDHFIHQHQPYSIRCAHLIQHDRVKILESKIVIIPTEVLLYEMTCLGNGYEGIMLRSPSAPYKFNRSTFKEAGLLKLKRFTDAEGEVVGVEELERNNNDAKFNNLGYTERSTHQANKEGANMLGALILKSPLFDLEFKVGTGFTEYDRITFWSKRDTLIGKTAKFKYQDIGVKDRPRFPVFLGWRED